jgi:opacity protein-like surface antigen
MKMARISAGSAALAFSANRWREGQSASRIPYADSVETSFAWNMGVGVRTALTDRFLMALEFSSIDLGDAVTAIDENNDAIDFSGLSSQRLLFGLNYRF